MVEKNEQAKKKSWLEQNKVMLKFCGLFGLMVFLFFSAAQSEYAIKTIAVWYPDFIASSVGKTTSLIARNVPKEVTPKFSSMQIENYGQIVRGVSRKTPRKTIFSMRIIYDCSGVFATSIYLAAVLAYPASMREKLIGCCMGIPFLAGMNIIRLVCMFFVGIFFPKLFHFFHIYLWQGIFIIFVIFTWMLWAELFVKIPKRVNEQD